MEFPCEGTVNSDLEKNNSVLIGRKLFNLSHEDIKSQPTWLKNNLTTCSTLKLDSITLPLHWAWPQYPAGYPGRPFADRGAPHEGQISLTTRPLFSQENYVRMMDGIEALNLEPSQASLIPIAGPTNEYYYCSTCPNFENQPVIFFKSNSKINGNTQYKLNIHLGSGVYLRAQFSSARLKESDFPRFADRLKSKINAWY